LRVYAEQVFNFIGKSRQEIAEILGNRKAEHFFRFASTQWSLPTIETYKALILNFGIDKMQGFCEYETACEGYSGLRDEYEILRRYFNNSTFKHTDVLNFSQQADITKKFNHPTQKPAKLCAHLIDICSRVNSLVLIPFVGSGVECEQVVRLNRNFIGYEIDKKYFNIANKRIKTQQMKIQLF
jgi:DNA modification methylase